MSRGWAFVDVETTGLNSEWDRVVSISVEAYDGSGRLEGELHSLVDPQRDPGPVHIHGLTQELLAGSPVFDALAPRVGELTRDRVLVAHNAQFDYKFLFAEAKRASLDLPTTHRLCTIALSRRLDLPVENHRLATIATYWGVRQRAAHDARDDVRVLREIFLRSQSLATSLGIALPVVSCSGRGAVVYPATIPRVPSLYVNPASWSPPARLVQGMKIVITGPTTRPRHDFARDLSARGFDVMNNVSGQTRLVICNEPGLDSAKHDKARSAGVPVLTESAVVGLWDNVEPGVLRGATAPPRAARPEKPVRTAGPWVGRSVLVLGGTAQEAAEARERVGALGARVLVNLGARTTHALCLAGAEGDRRHPTLGERAITILRLSDLDSVDAASASTEDPEAQPVVLGRGHVIDLPVGVRRMSVAASWSEDGVLGTGVEVDLVAFALAATGEVSGDEDFVFFNQPATPDGGVRLTVDGSCEQGIDLDLDALNEESVRIRIAAAIDGDATFGAVGAIRLSLSEADGDTEIATATLDAATEERTLVLAEVYERSGNWRFRAVGQGYEHGLETLVTDLGVEID